ncbi:MAG: Ig-like domain-containing protein [Oscillospiraceae bacterium]|nr:Ig-like domain-containing protein [Oscillospiraceae bacterium]
MYLCKRICASVLAVLLISSGSYLYQDVPDFIVSAEETAQQILELTEYTQTATLGIDLGGELTWLSSDTSVATVENGLVTAVGNGSAMIYAVCGDRRAEIPVVVEYDYYFDKTELTVETGTQKQLSFCSVHTKEAYNKLAVWKSSDESIATVDENGIITAISAGTAEITATAGDVTVTCVITCEESQKETDTSEEVKPEVLKFTEYTETAQLGVNYEGDVVWTSSNPDVATVKDGLVTAVGNGSAVITAVCGDKKAETLVEVEYGYYLKQTEISLISGTQNQLAFTSANNQKVYNQLAVWTSSDESIVKVDEAGIITGISEGTAQITATAGDASSVCTVTVVSPEILVKSTELPEGTSMELSISNYDGSVSWVSSDAKIVTVSENGTITGVKTGTATVYAMLENGKTISVNVTVIPAEEEAFLLGDANLDGGIDILDVITVNKAILGKEELTALQAKASDVNFSGVPDSSDALMIMKYIVGLVKEF